MPPAAAPVKVESRTWARDSHDLFDFEAETVSKQTFSISQRTCFFRLSNGDVQAIGEGEMRPPGGEPLLRLVDREGFFWVDRCQPMPDRPASNNRKLWLVVKDLGQQGHRLQEQDVMKLGRFKFRVRQLCSDAAGTQPELKLDESEPGVVYAHEAGSQGASELARAVCRICLIEGPGEDDPLISPCNCKGSIEYVHLACLRAWIRGRLNLSDDPRGSYFYRPLGCELCKAVYPAYVHTGSDRQPLVEVPWTQPPFIVLETMVRDTQVHSWRGFHVVSLNEKVLKLGRGHASDVRIADVSISRCHATIRFHKGNFLLEDNKAKFGTLVAMKKPRLLESGASASIQIGRTVLTFSAQADEGNHRLLEHLGSRLGAQEERALRLGLMSHGSRSWEDGDRPPIRRPTVPTDAMTSQPTGVSVELQDQDLEDAER